MSLLKRVLGLALAIMIVGCSAAFNRNDESLDQGAGESTPEGVDLPDLGLAPELHNEVWLNTPGPLRLTELRGKVVLLEFWTFG